MSTGPINPYTTPSEVSDLPLPAGDNGLADRGQRFGAAFLDGILISVITFPIQFLTGFFARSQTQSTGIVEQLLMMLLGVVLMLVLHGYLLVRRGQTIGKYALGIQIVDYKTGGLLPFFRVFVLRYLWLTPLGILAALIPGIIDDLAVNAIVFIDILMIFGRNRRCLHDYIAGSKVVKYGGDRLQVL